MKQIKNLKLKSTEGFEVKNLQRFPSMEFGDEGGMQADIHYNGKKILTVYQAGDGGCADCYWEKETENNEVKEKGLQLLRRLDPSYNPETSIYKWLKDKTPAKMNADDWEAVVNVFEDRYEEVQNMKGAMKKGYKSMVIMTSELNKGYLYGDLTDIPEKEVIKYLTKKGYTKKYTDFKIIELSDELDLQTL